MPIEGSRVHEEPNTYIPYVIIVSTATENDCEVVSSLHQEITNSSLLPSKPA